MLGDFCLVKTKLFQPLHGEVFVPKPTTTDKDSTLDINASGFGKTMFKKMQSDVKNFKLLSKMYCKE